MSDWSFEKETQGIFHAEGNQFLNIC